jgi:hypothetical protein
LDNDNGPDKKPHSILTYANGPGAPQHFTIENEEASFAHSVWDRCYDHNFLRFSPIFGEKIGVFLKKKQCYEQILQKVAVV